MKYSLIPLVLLLAACDPTPPPEPETQADRQPNAIFETQIQAVDKARAVEQQMQDAVEAQRRQLDEATPQ